VKASKNAKQQTKAPAKARAKTEAKTGTPTVAKSRARTVAGTVAGTVNGIVEVKAPSQRRLEVGARVAILQYKHLKCARAGFVQSINGGYNYVRPEGLPVTATDPAAGAFELYPNEIRVLAVYRHPDFKPGTIVRIKNLEWGQVKPKSHGIVCGVEKTRIIVQPMGARKGGLISLPPQDLQVERNDDQLSAEALVAQHAILAVLRMLDKPVLVSALKSLLATQPAISDIDEHLARLANAGKIVLSEGYVSCIKSTGGDVVPEALHLELHGAVDGLAQANQRLANAVHQAIVQALP
jgi:hypothetical protein